MTNLDRLRRRVDDIDDQLHDLLMRRIALADQVSAAKSGAGSGFFRPAREAEVLRRLVARHRGSLPARTVVRVWREIMSAMLGLQGEFNVAVFAPGDRQDYRELARSHFGADARMTTHPSTRGVVAAAREGAAAVGVLPLPADDGDDPWWLSFGPTGRKSLAIVARLPFAPADDGRRKTPGALVVGAAAPEPSSSDRSFLAVRPHADASRASLRAALTRKGFKPVGIFVHESDEEPAPGRVLVEVDGFVAADDVRFAQLIGTGKSPVQGIDALGSYATPFTAEELGGRAPDLADAAR